MRIPSWCAHLSWARTLAQIFRYLRRDGLAVVDPRYGGTGSAARAAKVTEKSRLRGTYATVAAQGFPAYMRNFT